MFRLWAGVGRLIAPGLRLALRRRARRGKEVPARLPEREGIDPTPRPDGKLIWFHAASMGESLSILPVLEELPRHLTLLVTTGTVTSAITLTDRMAQLGLRNALHRFVPLDVPAWAARFLDHWRPDAAVFVESELWPNLLAACERRRIPLLLVNARMSERSFRGWRRAPGLSAQLLGLFARIHPQSPADGDRLRALGATRLEAPGNLKLSAAPLPADDGELARLRPLLADHPVWLAASTHPGEEAVAAAVHRRLVPEWPGLVTVIAPRHAERGTGLAGELGAARRGAGEDPVPGGIWIADTMGELGLLYRLCPIVLVGRSLVGQGGQNPLEPARLGCAVVVGPFTQNFRDPVRLLCDAGALTVVADEDALARWVAALLRDTERRLALGEAGRAASSGDMTLPGRIAALVMNTAGLS